MTQLIEQKYINEGILFKDEVGCGFQTKHHIDLLNSIAQNLFLNLTLPPSSEDYAKHHRFLVLVSEYYQTLGFRLDFDNDDIDLPLAVSPEIRTYHASYLYNDRAGNL